MTASQNELYERIKEPMPSPSLFSKEKQLELSKLEIWLEKYDKSGDMTARHHRMLNEIYAKREKYRELRLEKFVTPYLPPHNIEHFKKQWIKSLDEDEVQGWVKYPLLAMKSFQNDYKIAKAQEKDKDLWETLGNRISYCKMVFDSEILPKHTDKEIIDTFFTTEEFFKELRAGIEKYADIVPLAEFGTNYAEFYHDSIRAVKKLLAEKQGQVAGAFFRDDLGDITLTWGNEKSGLKHILDRRKDDFLKSGFTEKEAQEKTIIFVERDLVNIIQNGELKKGKTRAFLEIAGNEGVIALNYKDNESVKWVITAYKKMDSLGLAYSHQNLACDPKLQLDSLGVESISLDSPNLADLHKGKARGADFSCSTHAESSKKNDTPRLAFPHKSEAHGDDFSTSSSAVSKGIIPPLTQNNQNSTLESAKNTQSAQNLAKPKIRRMR